MNSFWGVVSEVVPRTYAALHTVHCCEQVYKVVSRLILKVIAGSSPLTLGHLTLVLRCPFGQ